MLIDLFSEWFAGRFNNRRQTFADPRSAAYVIAHHERTFENQFRCSYYHHRAKSPYRVMLFDMNYHHGAIHLTDHKGSKLVFSNEGSSFIANSNKRINNKVYVYRAVLTKDLYRVNDQCYALSGELVRGLPEESWFEFNKAL